MKNKLFTIIVFLLVIMPINISASIKLPVELNTLNNKDIRYGYVIYPSNEDYELTDLVSFGDMLIPKEKEGIISIRGLNRFKDVDKLVITLKDTLKKDISINIKYNGTTSGIISTKIFRNNKKIVINLPKGNYNSFDLVFNNKVPVYYRIESIELLSTNGNIFTNQDVSIYLNNVTTPVATFNSNTKANVVYLDNNPKEFNITGIDKEIPSVNLKVEKKNSHSEVKSGEWSNEGLNFSFYGQTNGFSGASIYYCQDVDNSCIPETKYNKEITQYNIINGTFYLRYRIVSNSKAMSDIYSFKANVENIIPKGSIEIKKDNSNYLLKETDWSNEDISIKIKEDNNLEGVKVLYCKDLTNTCEPDISIDENKYQNILSEDGIYYIRYRLISRSSVSSITYSRIVKIDKSNPTVNLKVSKDGIDIDNNWQEKELDYLFADTSLGLSKRTIYYCIDKKDVCTPNIVVDTNLYKIEDNGVNYIRYRIKNEANTYSDIYSYEVKIDKEIPVTKIIAKNSNLVESDTWTNEGLSYSFVIEKTNSNSKIYYCIDKEDECSPNIEIKEYKSIDDYKDINGIYYIRYKTINEANIESAINSFKAKVDDSNPYINIDVYDINDNEVEEDKWITNNIKFKFSLENNNISKATIYYCIDQDNKCNPNIEIEENKIIDNYKDLNGIYYIRYKTINEALTETDIKSSKLMIDTKDIICNITKSTDDWTNQDITLTINVSNVGASGIEGYSWNNEEYSNINNKVIDNNQVVYAYVKNIAGKSFKCSVEVNNIDKEKPTCNLKLNGIKNNEVFVNEVTISFDNVNDNGEIDSYGINRVNGDKTILYDKDSDDLVSYTGFIKDKAGNVNTCDISFKKNSKILVTYNNNGGSLCSSKEVYYGKEYGELCLPVRGGYTFAGWYDDNDKLVTSKSIVKEVSSYTLNAKWIKNKYIITFEDSNCESITKEYGDEWGSLCTPVKEGYLFAGWYKENQTTLINETTTVTGNIKVFPKWVEDGFIITYDNNGGYGCYNMAVMKDVSIGSLCIPKKENSSFLGWYSEEEKQITEGTILDKDIRIYAKWKND